ncbi:MAG: ATP-binding protein [Candidatus Pacearchaeota archaeon]
MKCSNCSKKAIIEILWRKKRYCKEHFTRYFFGQVKKVLESKKYGATEIDRDTKICVALSGGKDSAVCFYVLKKLGYKVTPFHINLGIPLFSEKSLEKSLELGELLKEKVRIIDLKEELGFSIEELLMKNKKKLPCKVCGTVKRYIFNKFAFENNFDYIATGHNLSDIAAQGLNILINNQFDGFKNLLPLLPTKKEQKLCGRIKPLFFLSDEEIWLFARANEIPFLEEKCPYTADTPSLHQFKKFLNAIEKERPGTVRRFGFAFIELGKRFEEIFKKERKFRQCVACGYPSTTKKCYFCRLIQKIK